MKILDHILKGKERRIYQRTYMGIEIRISLPGLDEPMEATIQNIGGGGAKIIADRELPVPSKVNLEFLLPDDDTHIECEGEVVWCLPNKKWYMKDERGHKIGLKFVDLPQEKRAKLVNFVFSRTIKGIK